ncbi:MAG: calcium-binding protein [Leptolyngbya sp. IPPAS B-1204]|uniref:Calcium-binding protein n=1 Tax=Leptolyngbya sp. NK1-12 TaxID=2547451 RepID=A0AA96WH67_9CYAN|nr:calcium-binding protein [Leptolyngbya sp. NK1-12]MBF2048247.1 calcium-binding protein [Elainella sp. C42_A2020_010]WNZ25029.1 calcium-binding protein [Leptolyngbya sp. NK1-12]
MSELITVNPPGTPSTGPTLGLNIINEQPVQVFKQSATGPVVVAGSPGRDVIRVSSPGDVTGYVIEAEAGNDEIIGGAGEDQLSGGAGNDRIEGGRSRDKIFGGNGNDQLFGNEGIDVIDAGEGDDRVEGGDGNDVLLGGPGNDRLFGGNGEDLLRGGNGRDILSGGDGSDTMRGGRGNDLLIPGAGRDVMKGGFDRDTFRFEAGSTGPGQLDRITDFNPSDDTIELSRALLPGSGLGRGQLSSENFAIVQDVEAEVITVTATLVYEQKSGILYYNPASGQDVPLVQLQANLSELSAANFRIL